MPSDIFLSYAREDRGRVQPIADALARHGYDVWWDEGLRSGEDYRDRIEDMLKSARCVVVAWSAASLQSDFVIDEAGRAHRRKVLLPVFIDGGIEPPLGFGGIHTSDLSGWLADPDDPAFEQFTGDVDTAVGRKAASAAPAAERTAPPRARGGGWQRTLRGGMPRLLRGVRNVLAVLGLLLTAIVCVNWDEVPETAVPAATTVEPAPAADTVAAERVASVEGEERDDGKLQRIIR